MPGVWTSGRLRAWSVSISQPPRQQRWEPRAGVACCEYRVFAGVIDRHQWPFLSRLFFYALGGRLGDNRDWPAIDAWAEEIAHALAQRAT